MLSAAALITGALAGCGKEPATAAAPPAAAGGASGAASAAGGQVSVGSVRAVTKDVDVMLEATGTIAALNSVDIRPQVASTITKVHITVSKAARMRTGLPRKPSW